MVLEPWGLVAHGRLQPDRSAGRMEPGTSGLGMEHPTDHAPGSLERVETTVVGSRCGGYSTRTGADVNLWCCVCVCVSAQARDPSVHIAILAHLDQKYGSGSSIMDPNALDKNKVSLVFNCIFLQYQSPPIDGATVYFCFFVFFDNFKLF